MASALFALLSQQTPNLQTRKGLILTGLQNDFLSPDGKLPSNTASGILDRLKELVPAFREYGDVIWVRSHYEANRPVNPIDEAGDNVIAGPMTEDEPMEEDEVERNSPVPIKKARISEESLDRRLASNGRGDKSECACPTRTTIQDDDEELFLTRTATKEPCCIPGSTGADYSPPILDLIDQTRDMQLIKTYYSAFGSTSLLLTLRSKLITEIFICGCTTNLSVFATAMDAARYGIKVTLVEDCLGYRRKNRHDLAIKRLREIMEADVMTSTEVIEILRNPPPSSEEDDDGEDEVHEDDVVVGEDASGMPHNPLAVDSDEDGEDVMEPIVRPSTLSGRMLELRSASPATASLRRIAAAEAERPSSVEPSQPRGARATDASSTTLDGDKPDTDSEAHLHDGNRQNHVELGLNRSSVDHSIDDIESSGGVRHKEPWLDIIDEPWAEHASQRSNQSPSSTHPGLAALSAVVGLDQKTVNEYEEMMQETRHNRQQHDQRKLEDQPLFGEDKEQESFGSRILYNLLPPELAETIFSELNKEVTWQRMKHQTGDVPRLVCCQGNIDGDGSTPVYRHPSDQTLLIQSWTPAVAKVRTAAEEVVGHPFNHVLIQLYRGGTDFISEHSDKTLDIVKESFIVNVSFGAQRTMRLRTKRAPTPPGESQSPDRTTYRVPMPHNSMITMSLATNAEHLHGINADKRPAVELSEAEKAFDGQRISLTFRNIGSYLNADSSSIWGQGATGKTLHDAKPVINADFTESERLIRAFGAENQSSMVNWDSIYGSGFDALHLK